MAANKISKLELPHKTTTTRGGLVRVETDDGHVVYGLTEETALRGVEAARNPDNGKAHSSSNYQL